MTTIQLFARYKKIREFSVYVKLEFPNGDKNSLRPVCVS